MADACESYSFGQSLDYGIVLPELYPRVQNVEAVLQGKSIKVTWEAPAEGTPIGYNIYRDGNILNGSTPLSNLTFTETGIEQGIYAYNVKAVYEGNKESFAEMSNVICFSYTCETPKSLVGVAESKTAILTWEKPETIEGNFEGYNVYRDGVKINPTLVTNTTYSDENLLVGTYKYQVTALSDLCVETDKTEEVSVTILPELCEPPVNIELTNEEGAILITWEKPENVDGILKGYNVYHNDEVINEELISETEYRDEQPEGGYYQVSAVYEHCESELSGKVGIIEHLTSSFKLYPNPTSGELTIDNGQLTINNVEIYDVFGRIVETHGRASLQTITTINVAHLQSGIYFVKIYSEDNQFAVKRLVIMK
jgi:fibronectin type 3 domain-containing protein